MCLEILIFKCEGDLAVISVTPLIMRFDSADMSGQTGAPFFPHHSMWIPPEAAHWVKKDDLPQ